MFADTNNNVKAIIARVQALTVTLRTVAEDAQYVVFEVLPAASQAANRHARTQSPLSRRNPCS